MKIEVWVIGKTSEAYLDTGIAFFEKRIKNYLPFNYTVLPNIRKKTTDSRLIRQEEAQLVLGKLSSDDYLVLLDERGKTFTSIEFAQWIERQLGRSSRRIIFLIGGAFGFAPEVYARANAEISLSRLTFSHQMVRLFFLEQLYRAMTILRNEPYHNE
ncbi:MAG: 23S rRNA (pseudouridine(1915)-N(3))-methyltransferase RlmH [Bacteroidetes bacterium]|nr:MAG: 23S rRNA (pseudouridine(1915)-N(3))-methyltransferase RlmH [Bacteroidota bacterium]